VDTSKETFKAFQQDDVLSAADVASSVVIKPEEEFAYGFIIEVLTSGLYPDVFHVIREERMCSRLCAWALAFAEVQEPATQRKEQRKSAKEASCHEWSHPEELC
jgi:hypothetical protein